MTLYVLDTDILSLYQSGHSTVCQCVSVVPPDEVAVTVISVEEQLSGWYTLLRRAKRRDQIAGVYERLTRTVASLAQARILTYSVSAIDQFEALRTLKLRVRATDLRIAAIALDAGAIVVTRNARDFSQIPGLTVEDWSV